MTNDINEPRKDYNEPMHSAEHILNQTMIRLFGTGRSINAHIEAKKSKCDYLIATEPTQEQLAELTKQVNSVISQNLPIYAEFHTRDEVKDIVDLSKLPDRATEKLRIVYIGNYDICACIGAHVTNTSEIGTFEILSSEWKDGKLRLRWRVQ